jgi:hypothetical protein
MGQYAADVIIQKISTKTLNRLNASLKSRVMQLEDELDSST